MKHFIPLAAYLLISASAAISATNDQRACACRGDEYWVYCGLRHVVTDSDTRGTKEQIIATQEGSMFCSDCAYELRLNPLCSGAFSGETQQCLADSQATSDRAFELHKIRLLEGNIINDQIIEDGLTVAACLKLRGT